jgi:putative oxidoreductase
MVSNSSAVEFRWARAATIAARVCLSALFLISGVGKLIAPAATVAAIESAGLPVPPLAFLLAVGIEVGCAGALLAGFKVRWTAGILAAFTVTTAIFFHADFADPNQVTQFLKNVSIAGGLLYAVVLGDRKDT